MTGECLEWLTKRGQESARIVEIGCWKGRSTAALLRRSAAKLWAVDTWAGTLGDDKEQDKYFEGMTYAYSAFRSNLAYYFERQQIIPLHMTSVEGAHMLRTTQPNESMDLIFIDGDHRESAVRDDIELYLPLVKRGGILAGHDYSTLRWRGVKRAVDKFFGDRVWRGPGSIWFVRA